MYFAHQLYTRDRAQFDHRVMRDELTTCPPTDEEKDDKKRTGQLHFSWNNGGRRVLHDAAPFAVVRWTNFWYPSVAGFFGDWFGGRLAPLFGKGIKDVPITGNRPYRWSPGAAHAMYLGFPDDRKPGSFTTNVTETLDINSATWLPKDPPPYDPDTADVGATPPDDSD
jgi:hypothetical protein